MIVTNSFSLNMIEREKKGVQIKADPITLSQAREIAGLGAESAVGHADTAKIFSSLLGVEIPAERKTLSIKNGSVLVGQYTGPRLPEGATELPEGAEINWWIVEIRQGGES